MPGWVWVGVLILLVQVVFSHPVSAGVLDDGKYQDTMQKPVVRVGYYENPPKLYTSEDGTILGFWPDLVHYIAAQKGWEVIWVPGTWEEGLGRLERGEIDIMPDVAWNEARSRIYEFSAEKVLVSWSRLYIRRGSGIETILDLEGKTVAGLIGSINFDGTEGIKDLTDNFDLDVTFVDLESYTEVFEAIQDGNVDAGITNRDFGNQNERNYSNVERSPFVFQPVHITFAYPKDSDLTPFLVSTIDSNLMALKADPDSVYYVLLETHMEEKAAETVMFVEVLPTWVLNLLYIGGGLVLLLFLTSTVSRLEVRRKTASLQRLNTELGSQMEERRRAEEQYRSIAEDTPALICTYQSGGRITFINKAYCDYFETTRDELVGKSFLSFIPESDRDSVLANISALTPDSPTQTHEHQVIAPGSEVRWQRWTNRGIFDENGNVLAYQSIGEDITEQKRVELALRESEARYRLALDNSSLVLAQTNRDLRYDWIINPHSDFDPASVFGKRDDELGDNEGARKLVQLKQNVIETGSEMRMDIVFPLSDGPRTYDVIAKPLRNADGEVIGVVTSSLDITERKKTEMALQESHEQLADAQRTAKTGSWVYYPATQQGSWSDQMYRLHDLETSESTPSLEEYFSMIHPEDLPGIQAAYARVIENRQPGTVEYRTNPDRGPIRHLQGTVEVIHEENGEFYLSGITQDITERKEAENALREAETRYRTLVEQIPNAVTYIDSAHPGVGTLYISPQIEALLGYTPQEWLAEPLLWQKHIHPEDRERILAQDKLHDETGRHFDEEYRLIARDGSLVWVYDQATMLHDEVGNLTYSHGIMVDITERKEREALIRNQARQIEQILETTLDGYILADTDGQILDVNPSYCALIGYTREELLAMNIRDVEGQLSPDQVRERIEEMTKNGRARFETRHIDKNGVKHDLDVSIVIVQGQERPSVAAFVRDISDRKQAEHQINIQLSRLNALHEIDLAINSELALESTLDVLIREVVAQLNVDAAGVLMFDPETQLLNCVSSTGFKQATFQRPSMRPGEGFAGRVFDENRTLIIPDLMNTGSKLAEALQAVEDNFVEYCGTPLVIKGQIIGVLETYHRSPIDHDREWLNFLEVLAGQASVAIDNASLWDQVQDYARSLEQRVMERTAELERANRVKAEFLANMSHELRTPLNSILGLSESLLEQRRGSLNEQQQHFLETIETSGRHLLDLINDILDLSKIEAGKFDFHPQVISVDELCKSSLAFVKNQALKKSIIVTYDNQAQASSISADPRRLKQILINLLTNAVKFTPENGQVRFEVRTEIELELIQFSISDTGIGIPLDDLPRLFTPFVQLDSSLSRQHEGTGLGLALIQRLTDLHGGSIEVESEVGKGSRFTVNLPCCEKDSVEAVSESTGVEPGLEGEAPSQSSKDAAGWKILLAEDNTANVLTIGEYLDTRGYQIRVAHDGLQAIEKAEEFSPDIILMDIQMPGMNGLEAIGQLRANPRFASTPIIALTALAMPGDRERCLEAGANEYMSKPVSLKHLMKTIVRLLS